MLRVQVPAHSFAVWVQEAAPTAGSGSNTAHNSGSTTPVTVPANTFTNTTPSRDVSPGMVKGIRIIAYPTNTTSLTINTAICTASSPEFSGLLPAGVLVPTTGEGAPNVPIQLDPALDTDPVSISFVAVDNVGNESANVGTAVVASVLPDLSPILYVRPTTIAGPQPITLVVDVLALTIVNSAGLVTVRITRDASYSLTFPPASTTINSRPVQNSNWSFTDSNPGYYELTTISSVAGENVLSFGLTGTMMPGSSKGTVAISTLILGGSGGEVNSNNNSGTSKVDYFPN